MDADILLMSLEIVAAYQLAVKPLCKRVKLSQSSLDVLLYIADHPSTTAKDICDAISMKANLVSMCVDRLCQAEYITRCTEQSDKRQVCLDVTEKGKEIVSEANKLQKTFWAKLEEDLLAKELGDVKDYLSKLLSQVNSLISAKLPTSNN